MKIVNENFTNVFDSSLIDYSSDFESQDCIYLKRQNVIKWLWEHDSEYDHSEDTYIIEYDKNDDKFYIDVKDDFNLMDIDDGMIPNYIQFRHIYGNFSAVGCNLLSFKGMPFEVDGDCDLQENLVFSEEGTKSLEGIPFKIEGSLTISNLGWKIWKRIDGQSGYAYTRDEINWYKDYIDMIKLNIDIIEQCKKYIKEYTCIFIDGSGYFGNFSQASFNKENIDKCLTYCNNTLKGAEYKLSDLNDKINESFSNVFDSSLIDYSDDAEKSDERYLKNNLILDWLEANNGVTTDRDMYSINSDFSVDVHGDFDVPRLDNDELPDFIQFKNIYGNFCAWSAGLRSFRGLPVYVEGDCDLSDNCVGDNDEVDNLQYLPKRIGGDLDLSNNGYCERCGSGWTSYTNIEREENYYDNLFILNTIKQNIESCGGTIKLGEDESMPCSHICKFIELDDQIADLQDDINNKIWLKWMVEDGEWSHDDEWDEECTKWVQEHWPEIDFSGKKYPDDFEEDEEELDESFSNVFDSSLVDYSDDFKKHDLEHQEWLEKERGWISDEEYDKVLDVFKDFIIPEETFLKHTKKPTSANNSLSMINLTLSREKFENATGIKKSSVFYKKEDLLHIDNKWYSKQQIYGQPDYPSAKQYHPAKGSIWDQVKNGIKEYKGDSPGILIYDKITFQLNRPKSSRPYWQVRTLKHLADGKHLDVDNRGAHISHTRNMDSYGYGYYDLDDIINIILKRLYKVLKFSGYGYPTVKMLTY